MKRTKDRNPLRNRILIIAIAFIAAILALVFSLIANSSYLVIENSEYLTTSTNQTAQRLNDLFDDSLRDVQTAADVFEASLDSTEIQPTEAAKVLDLPQFDHTFFITPRGMAFKPDGTTGVATEKYYYTQGIQGSSGLCYIDDALFDGESVIAFFTPVRFKSRVAGVVVCAYRESTLANYLTVSFSGQQLQTYLCQPDGRIIASTGSEELGSDKYIKDVLSGVSLEGASIEQASKELESGGSVGFTYGAPHEPTCAHATKLLSFDWIIVRMLPANITGKIIFDVNVVCVLLAGWLIAIAALVIALLLRQTHAQGTPEAISKASPFRAEAIADAPSKTTSERPTRIESVFASSLTKDIRSHTDLMKEDPNEKKDSEKTIRQEAEGLAQEQERLKSLNYQGKRILLTEDNAMATSIARELLELTGAEVEHAKNGQQALDRLLDHDPDYYDIVLMDIQMPVMNGYDATRAIRKASDERPDLSDIPVIALSADMFAEDIRNSQEAGMNDHIAKPLEVSTLVDMLQKWMG